MELRTCRRGGGGLTDVRGHETANTRLGPAVYAETRITSGEYS